MGSSVQLLFGSPVNGSVVVPSKSADRLGGKHVGVDDVAAKIGDKLRSETDHPDEPA